MKTNAASVVAVCVFGASDGFPSSFPTEAVERFLLNFSVAGCPVLPK